VHRSGRAKKLFGQLIAVAVCIFLHARIAPMIQIMFSAGSRASGLKIHKTPSLDEWKSCCDVVDGSRSRKTNVHSRKPSTRTFCSVKHQWQIFSEATSQAETSTIAIGGWAHLSHMTFQSCDCSGVWRLASRPRRNQVAGLDVGLAIGSVPPYGTLHFVNSRSSLCCMNL
jgi:hypothetical protein